MKAIVKAAFKLSVWYGWYTVEIGTVLEVVDVKSGIIYVIVPEVSPDPVAVLPQYIESIVAPV